MANIQDLIFPRLKANYKHEIYAGDEGPHVREHGWEGFLFEDQPILQPLFGDLVMAFGLDSGEQYELLQNSFLQTNPGLDQNLLYQIAFQNLVREAADQLQLHGDPEDVAMLTAGGNFEACLLLFNDLWDQLAEKFGMNMLVSVPANDLIFIAEADKQDRLAELVQRTFEDENTTGHLSKAIYQRIGMEWELLDKAF